MAFPFTVYILKCADGHYYVGCTSDLTQRLDRHQKGFIHYTKSRLPVECINASALQINTRHSLLRNI